MKQQSEVIGGVSTSALVFWNGVLICQSNNK